MKKTTLLLIAGIFLLSCIQPKSKKETPVVLSIQQTDTTRVKSYDLVLEAIKKSKVDLIKEYNKSDRNHSLIVQQITDFWITSIGIDLYQQWKSTPWDFNGTTRRPKEGKIACGYFVTTLLLDMGYKLDRIKLSTCDALTMMKKLTSSRSIKNLSYLKYDDFNQQIKEYGKGVFIIGLDYHVGFLINDGVETWFLHSNYIMKTGVIKEPIRESKALKQSTTRFVTCLTCDNSFVSNWINK